MVDIILKSLIHYPISEAMQTEFKVYFEFMFVLTFLMVLVS